MTDLPPAADHNSPAHAMSGCKQCQQNVGIKPAYEPDHPFAPVASWSALCMTCRRYHPIDEGR